MRIIFAGSPEVAVPTLHALAREHDVVAVLTRAPSPVGRRRVMTRTPVAAAAVALSLPTIEVDRPDAATAEAVRELNADLGVVVAYGALLRPAMLNAPELGWINLHFSHLPEYRGAAPLQRTIIDGHSDAGLTVFRLVEELDAGDVVARATSALGQDETAGEALTRLGAEGAPLVADAVRAIAAGTAEFVPQEGQPTVAAKLMRDDGRLSFDGPGHELYARFRGVTPEPGAWTHTSDGVLKIHRMLPAEGEAGEPGVAVLAGQRALAASADSVFELVTVQPAGKPAMDAAAWLRGRGGRVVLAAGNDA